MSKALFAYRNKLIRTWKRSIQDKGLVDRGHLKNRFEIREKDSGDDIELTMYGMDYSFELEKGRGKRPNLQFGVIEKWGARKGLDPKHIRNTYSKIRRRGAKPHPFLYYTSNNMLKSTIPNDLLPLALSITNKGLQNEYHY